VPVKVSVRTDFEQYPMSSASHSTTYVGKDQQERETTHEVNFNVDVEGHPKK
jgi:hypothetical protein